MGLDIVSQSVGITRYQSHPQTLVCKDRKLFWRIVVESRRCFFISFGQRNPCLYHLQASRQSRRVFESFGVCNAAAGSHPVYLAGPYDLLYTEAVAMRHLSAEQI